MDAANVERWNKVLNPYTVMLTPAFIEGVTMPGRVYFGVKRRRLALGKGYLHPPDWWLDKTLEVGNILMSSDLRSDLRSKW